MDKSPLASILMNCYNSEKFLKETLASVWGQTYRNWQLVFVENHSTDQSRKILEDHAQGDERLVLVQTPAHMPLGEAREYGLQFCKGDYISFLDTDDIWLPEKLERQLEVFARDPETCLCYTSAELINEKGNVFSKKKLKPKAGNLFGQNLSDYEVNFQTVMIKRSTLDRVHPPCFDPKLSYSPDYDLIMRVLAEGKAICLQDILVQYRVRGGSLSEKTTHLWAKELAYTFRKLKKSGYLASLSTKKQELAALAKMDLQRWRCHIRSRNLRKARSILRKHRFRRSVFFLLWLLSFCPFLPDILILRRKLIQLI